MVVLPDPAPPTTATVSPGLTRRSSPRSTGPVRGVAEGRRRPAPPRPGRVGASATASAASADRPAPCRPPRTPAATLARACWPMVSRLDSIRTGADQLGQVGGEGEEGAEGDLPADREPAAEDEHADLAEGRDRLQQRVVPAGQPDRAQPGGEQPPGRAGDLAELLLLLAEALDHPDPGDRVVDQTGHVAGLLLGLPGGREQRAAGTGSPPTTGSARPRARPRSAAATGSP